MHVIASTIHLKGRKFIYLLSITVTEVQTFMTSLFSWKIMAILYLCVDLLSSSIYFFYLHNSVSKFIILWYCIWLSPKDIGPRNQSVINCRGSWCNSEDSAWDNHIAYWNAYLQVLAACPFPCPTNEYPERKPEMAPVESLSPSGRTGLSCLNQAQASI